MSYLLPILAALSLSAKPHQNNPQLNPIPAQEQSVDSIYRTWSNNAWTGGEYLKYRVHYGVINAGEIEMTVEKETVEINKRKVWHINAKGRSYSGFDWFFKVRDHFQTYIDQASIVPHQFVKSMQEGGYNDTDFALFNHKKKWLSSKKGSMRIEPDVQDVISAIYYARTLDISKASPGDTFPLQVYLDGVIYPLRIKYIGKEVIKTDIGKVNAVKVIPMVVADRVFKEDEGLELWVSDDANKVPLRVKAALAVGSIKVDITGHKNLKHKLNKP
ncbi:MAG: DUF3108 domain-containing protein [Bacteroidetes bacterium]|nr:MAG: DUF3108 domain-containing protein [Bacteroidota bacterium]